MHLYFKVMQQARVSVDVFVLKLEKLEKNWRGVAHSAYIFGVLTVFVQIFGVWVDI